MQVRVLGPDSDDVRVVEVPQVDSIDTAHRALDSEVHGVGSSTVESAAGAQAKVDDHSALDTGVHGVGASTVESASGAQNKVDTHANLSTHPYLDAAKVWTALQEFDGNLKIPSYTKAGLPAAGTAGRVARVSDDVRGEWMDQGGQWFSLSSEKVNVQEFGASPSKTAAENTTAIQAAIDALPGGGVVELTRTTPSEYAIDGTLTIPKTPQGIVLRGSSRNGTRILAKGLGSTTPVIKWDDSVSGHVEHSGIEDMTVDRDNAGPIIQFRQNSGNTGASGDRWKGFLSNLQARQTAGSTGTLIEIEFTLKGWMDRIRVDGGGLGLHLNDGSHAQIYDLYHVQKSTAPDLMLVEGGGSHTIVSPRSAGSAGNYSYKFLNTGPSTIIDPQSEGDDEDAIYLIEGSNGLVFIRPVVATNNNSQATNPRGMRFINSQNVEIIGGDAVNLSATLASGRTFGIDSNCRGIRVDGMRMHGSDPAADIVDNGVNSSFLIYKRDSTPAYEEFTSGQVFQHGGLARGGSKVQYGTADVQDVELVRGGATLLALLAGGVEITGDLNANTDDLRDLASDAVRWRDLYLSGRFTMGRFRTVADGDATPAVGATGLLKTANSAATTITALDNGREGQPVMVVFGDSNTTVDFTGTNLKGNGGADWSPSQDDHMTCIFDGTNWFCDISDNTA